MLPCSDSSQAMKGVTPTPPATQIWLRFRLWRSSWNRPYGPSTVTGWPTSIFSAMQRVKSPSALMKKVIVRSPRSALAMVKGWAPEGDEGELPRPVCLPRAF